MELRICRDEFLKGVNIVHNVAITKGTMPILSHLLIQASDNRIYLYGTDLELGIKGEVEAQVLQEGSICLSAKMMNDILRELPEKAEVHFLLEDNNRVKIRCGRVFFHLAGLPQDEFPPFPAYQLERSISIPPEVLRDMIMKINITVPLVEQKHLSAPNGALLEIDREAMELMGTDGHRLSYVKKPGIEGLDQQVKVIVPKKAMNELKRILDDSSDIESVSVGFFENQTIFKIGRIELFSRLLEAYFPNIRARIAKVNDKILTINRQALRQSVKRVSIFTEEKERYIRLKLEEGILYLSSQNLGVGDAEDQLPVDYDGEPLEIGFNSSYILDILNLLTEEEVVIELSDQGSHGIIRQVKDRDYLYIIMPIKLYDDEEFS